MNGNWDDVGSHMDGWNGWAMAGWMFGFWMLVVLLVILALRTYGGLHPRSSEAERLLAERFARGEIDADEYARRRELLRVSH
ncbi:MAG: SHOCT domain-containing protein [Oryzihumus sp.]